MVQQVYKCDFCRNTGKTMSEMIAHEGRCYMNPTTKDCGTCKNNEKIPYEFNWACKFGWDFQDEKTLPCERWLSNKG